MKVLNSCVFAAVSYATFLAGCDYPIDIRPRFNTLDSSDAELRSDDCCDVLVSDVGTGDVGAGDVGAGDVGMDVPEVRGAISITVREKTTPLSNVQVLFNRPDGSWEATLMTGTDGRLTHDIARGGSITVIVTTNAQGMGAITTRLWTLFDLQPGDGIVLDVPSGSRAMVNIRGTYVAPVGGCLGYSAYTCGGSSAGALGNPVSNWAYESCAAQDGSVATELSCSQGTGIPTLYILKRGIQPQFGTATTVNFDFGGVWSSAYSNTSLNFTGFNSLPAGSSGARVTLSPLVDGVNFSMLGSTAMVQAPANMTWNRSVISDQVGGYLESTGVDILFAPGRRGSLNTWSIWTTPRNGVLVDLATLLPPPVRAGNVSEGIEGRHTVNWTVQGIAPSSVDGIRVEFSPASGRNWIAVVPPGRTSITFPEIPMELSNYRSAVPAYVSVTLVDASDVNGYREFVSGSSVVRDGFGMIPPLGQLWRTSVGFIAPN